MANIYVDSNAGGGAGTGVDWANAYLTLAAAITGGAAGDNFWIAHNHAETSGAAAITLSVKGTFAAPNTFFCVNSAGSVPPVSADLRTTATVTTTGAFGISVQATAAATGVANWYGVTFSAGTGATNVICRVQNGNQFRNCKFRKLGTTANSGAITVGDTGVAIQYVHWDNCTVEFGNTGDGISVAGHSLTWTNTASAIAGATIPTILFRQNSAESGVINVRGVDLSALGSGTLVSTLNDGWIIFENCRLGTNFVVATRAASRSSRGVDFIRCDSGATSYVHGRFGNAVGDQVVETTIVRTGGATDGTTPISWKITTTADAQWLWPFESQPITICNDTAATDLVVTVYGVWGGAAVPNNDDIWMVVEYMGSASYPISSFATTSKADSLATGTAYASDSSTWGGSTTQFKMVATLSSPQPAMVGPITVRIYAGAASQTFYIDPEVNIGANVSRSLIQGSGVFVNEIASGSEGGGTSVVGGHVSVITNVVGY